MHASVCAADGAYPSFVCSNPSKPLVTSVYFRISFSLYMDILQTQMIERMVQEWMGEEVFHNSESLTENCQPLKSRQSSVDYEQHHQLTDDFIQGLPPLFDDFDTLLSSSCCNILLPAASYDRQFRDDFVDGDFLNMGEKLIEVPSLSELDDSFFYLDDIKFDTVSPSVGNIDRPAAETKIPLLERKKLGFEKTKDISYAELSNYFDMPITQAAKKLNVGLTVLKKKCREYGIPRWPHRKMKSLRCLINSVQELAMDDGEVGDHRSRLAVEVLKEQARQLEKMPSMELPENTKRLRQACFKANYKKKRLLTQGFGTPMMDATKFNNVIMPDYRI